MRVLMTGFTSLQVGGTNRPISKIDVPASVVDALTALGHVVDWRRVEPGDNLSDYDVAWVNLAPLNSLNGRAGAMGALYALSSGLPCVGYFDDWQFGAVFNGARALVRRPEMLYKHMLVGAAHRGGEGATYFSREEADAAMARACEKTTPENCKKMYVERYYFNDNDDSVRRYESRLVESARALLDSRWSLGMVGVCPMYRWGDRSLVRKRMPKAIGPLEPLDPSPTIYELLGSVDPVDPGMKERSWVLGALMPHDAWLQKKSTTWPVEIVGSKKMVRVYGGHRLKSEQDVLEFYSKRWGILSPPYMHAGSGWWRSRFMYAARVGSVLVCDKGEAAPLGNAYHVRISDVEKMTTDELAATASAQADALRQYMPPYETFAQHCEKIINRAVLEDKGLVL